MFNRFLVTPRYALGSDSFFVTALGPDEAREQALEKIRKENWHDPNGWMLLKVIQTFEDGNP